MFANFEMVMTSVWSPVEMCEQTNTVYAVIGNDVKMFNWIERGGTNDMICWETWSIALAIFTAIMQIAKYVTVLERVWYSDLEEK